MSDSPGILLKMSHISHPSRPRSHRERHAAHSPLGAPIMLFLGATVLAAAYIAYILWPRWPTTPVSLDAPALPIMVSGVMFLVEPAAIRMPVQRKPGAQERVDLAYLWPSLVPPDPALKPTVGAPLDPNERLFVTIANGEATLSVIERVKTIYPRYLAEQASAGPPGLTLRGFRDGTPYQNEDLIYDPQAPEHFLARCSRHGVGNSGMCLLERRIGNADLTLRFPRDWLSDWETVTKRADSLIERLHPAAK
jgi:hypothetical protein